MLDSLALALASVVSVELGVSADEAPSVLGSAAEELGVAKSLALVVAAVSDSVPVAAGALVVASAAVGEVDAGAEMDGAPLAAEVGKFTSTP